MQSGKRREGRWLLQFECADGVRHDPLTGWPGGGDTQAQVRLRFESEAEAVDYAKRSGIGYEVEAPRDRALKLQAYADNFR
jgi:hypothetical protein